ncbi:hypothetical protein [Methylobacterium sp. E-046]|uniref:hypothetical protein n=1 Tax=Methylobacterium sp. E-046 TaxID=2836576 RepID=UPI001FB91596|nr:hypothetical protein [Methylobacterium sp. E-046]MCJ2102967.1 hypothetical protein [Methylobacterium sp. E-046]
MPIDLDDRFHRYLVAALVFGGRAMMGRGGCGMRFDGVAYQAPKGEGVSGER